MTADWEWIAQVLIAFIALVGGGAVIGLVRDAVKSKNAAIDQRNKELTEEKLIMDCDWQNQLYLDVGHNKYIEMLEGGGLPPSEKIYRASRIKSFPKVEGPEIKVDRRTGEAHQVYRAGSIKPFPTVPTISIIIDDEGFSL